MIGRHSNCFAEIIAAGGEQVVVIVPTELRTLGSICDRPRDAILNGDAQHQSPWRDLLHQWADETDAPVCDPTDELSRSAMHGEIPRFPVDSHLNGPGHQILADMVATSTAIRQFLANTLTPQ